MTSNGSVALICLLAFNGAYLLLLTQLCSIAWSLGTKRYPSAWSSMKDAREEISLLLLSFMSISICVVFVCTPLCVVPCTVALYSHLSNLSADDSFLVSSTVGVLLGGQFLQKAHSTAKVCATMSVWASERHWKHWRPALGLVVGAVRLC